MIESGSTYIWTHHLPCAAIDCWASEGFPVWSQLLFLAPGSAHSASALWREWMRGRGARQTLRWATIFPSETGQKFRLKCGGFTKLKVYNFLNTWEFVEWWAELWLFTVALCNDHPSAPSASHVRGRAAGVCGESCIPDNAPYLLQVGEFVLTV